MKLKKKERVKQLITELRTYAENDYELHRISVLERDCESLPVVHIIDENTQEFNGQHYHKERRKTGHYDDIHRDVYRYYCGNIPRGYVIHHIDSNPANNSIDNLQLMEASEHNRLHMYQSCVKQCPTCGKEFTARTVTQHYCSYECANANAKKFFKICNVCGAEFYTVNQRAKRCDDCRSKGVTKNWDAIKECYKGICPVCGKKFKKHNETDVYCSKECHNKAREDRAKKRLTKDCPVCGKTFLASHKGQKYCSSKCKKRNTQQRLIGFCEHCQKKFQRKYKEQKYCSIQCANKGKKARGNLTLHFYF